MKKFIALLRKPFRVQYRLTVFYTGDSAPRHTYGCDGRLLRRMARNTEQISDYWTLYKRGPLGLPEREVDSYSKDSQQ